MTDTMTDSIENWNKTAWTEVAKLPGDVGTALREQWQDHAAQDKVVVTLFGPYDTGKSTLLKRLLVDEACAVPDWLTISARRETFEQNEVECLGLIFRDTPGIAGGNSLHEDETAAALLHTDVIAVVLPPQLLTGNEKGIAGLTSILDGSRFHCDQASAYAAGTQVVAMARMDEAGADPMNNLSGYEALVTRKRDELNRMLTARKVEVSCLVLHAIVADPSGLLGNAMPSGREEYDAGRQWDGIGALVGMLRSLIARKAELRLYSERRFLCAQLGTARLSRDAAVRDAELAHQASQNDADERALHSSRLQALLGAARADLNRRVEEEVTAASRRGDSEWEAVRTIFHERVTASLERWWVAQDAAVNALAAEINTEVEQRRARPDWQAMCAAFQETAPPAKAKPPVGASYPSVTAPDHCSLNLRPSPRV